MTNLTLSTTAIHWTCPTCGTITEVEPSAFMRDRIALMHRWLLAAVMRHAREWHGEGMPF